ncbi:hypothetical protein CQ12_03950 [Bradyrhizobium jicamae]|uniref:Uncharacterized protein n=1 Tax=Bradyrhizobium jicamae TaxID=280332 RepID=A0A0R3KJV4_9BRAD|nr:hypothetical protein [Bradyrhizobium jicamae]KRQ95738.1 hypothetical protein CQ12_03950 [Bradyrhizobium jicamae]
MDPEIILLNVQRSGGEKISVCLKLTELDRDICRLAVAWPVGGPERTFDAPDFYECLRAFRRVVEPEGFRVLCQGARPNVCPSGMSSAAGAWKCWAHKFGEPAASRDQLVETFDPVEDINGVGTVAEQDEWIARHWEEFKVRTSAR